MPFLVQQPQRTMQRRRPTMPLGRVCPFTPAVLLGEPRRFLTDCGSPELSEGAGGWNRHVHVVLPLPGSVGPLAHPQAQGKEP